MRHARKQAEVFQDVRLECFSQAAPLFGIVCHTESRAKSCFECEFYDIPAQIGAPIVEARSIKGLGFFKSKESQFLKL